MKFIHKSYFKIPVFTVLVIAGVFFLDYNPLFDLNYYISELISIIYVVLLSLFIINYRFTNSLTEIGLVYNNKSSKYISSYTFYAIVSMLILTFFNFVFGGITTYNTISIDILNYGLVTLIIQSALEEIVFRGVILKSIMNDTKEIYAIIISSILFSIVHGYNPYIDVISLINIFLAGVLLGYIYVRTNSLLPAIAFHITWNFTQGIVLGVSTSGYDYPYTILTTSMSDTLISSLFIGTNFGYESGIICLVLLTLMIWQLNSKK